MTPSLSLAGHIPSANVQGADRTIIVEASPLARSPRKRLGIVIDQPESQCLLLRGVSRFHVILTGVLLLSVPATIAAVLLLGLLPFESLQVHWTVPILVLSLALGPVGVTVGAAYGRPVEVLFCRRPLAVFDHQTGRMTYRHFPGRRAPGGCIRATQLVDGWRDREFHRNRACIQLNLILDDAANPRVGFITFRDAEWTREAARKLADYLGVPLVDQLGGS
jgi:hypothetical protein